VRHYDRLGDEYFLDERKVQSDFWPSRYDVELLLLGELSGDLLDVGCATGSFVKLALQAGFRAQGIDLMAPAVAYGRRRFDLPLAIRDFTDPSIEPASLDVVTLWATLEHLADPGAFLRQAQRILRPGGAIAVSVPNHRSLTQRVLGQRNRYVCIEHLNYFSEKTLSALLSRHGFAVDRVSTRKINPKTIIQDVRAKKDEPSCVEALIQDQMGTDNIKTRPLFAGVRVLHGQLERGLGFIGLGDLLLMRGRKS
jgi:SAM-dependent methyltransferase